VYIPCTASQKSSFHDFCNNQYERCDLRDILSAPSRAETFPLAASVSLFKDYIVNVSFHSRPYKSKRPATNNWALCILRMHWYFAVDFSPSTRALLLSTIDNFDVPRFQQQQQQYIEGDLQYQNQSQNWFEGWDCYRVVDCVSRKNVIRWFRILRCMYMKLLLAIENLWRINTRLNIIILFWIISSRPH
jgi:hypothetical protein